MPDLTSAILPDYTTFNDKPYHKYPADIFDNTRHSSMIILIPYLGEIKTKVVENTEIEFGELPPIFLKMPLPSETSYSHNYSTESILYNAREFEKGGTRAGGLAPVSGVSVSSAATIGGSVLREGLRLAQNLPGGDSVRNSIHGGAKASIALLYENPNLRSHSFSWKFLPVDKDDEEAYIDFITYAKWLSSPVYGLATQRYPALFDIQMSSVDYGSGVDTGALSSTALNSVKQFTRCVLTSVDESFSPSGGMLSPSGLPQEIDVTLTFMEVMVQDREGILNEVGAISGNTTLNNAVESALSNQKKPSNTGIAGLLGSL